MRCDGVETTRFYDVVATYKGQEFAFSIAATTFDNLDWVAKHLPSGAYICPGRSLREHLTVAARQLSGDVETRQVFAHSGWVRLSDGEMAFLHGGGALTKDGDREVEVILPPDLAPLHLIAPASNADLITAVRASLSAWKIDTQGIAIIAIVAAYGSLLGSVAFSVFLVGPSGVSKTEIAALAQGHFGAGFGSNNLPASWSSTENSLEMQAFYAKDTLLVVDDFAPQPGSRQQQTLHSKAERLLRAQGNGSGRGRMNADGSLRLTRPPRGLILSTGEEVPRGHSVRARALIVEVEPNVVNVERLTVAQEHARAGLYAQTFYGFVRYLAAHYDEIEGYVQGAVERERERALEAEQSTHARLPDIVGQMMVGAEMFLRFAQEIGAVSSGEAVTLLDRVRAAVSSVAARQTDVQRDAEPVSVYLDLLRAAISSGRAHLAAPDGRAPESPSAWGWRSITLSSGEEWKEKGDRIGYVDGDDLYLVPQAAYKAAQNVGGESSGLAISAQTLNKRLAERGLLRSTDHNRNTLTVRRVLEAARRDVLHLHPRTLFPSADLPDQPDHSDHEAPEADEFHDSSGRNGRVGQVIQEDSGLHAVEGELFSGSDVPLLSGGHTGYGYH